MKCFTQTFSRFGLVALILSLAIVSAASAAQTAFIDPNDPTAMPGILGIPPGHSYRFNVDLSTMDPVLSDLTGLIRQDWTTITLQMDIDIEYPLEVDGSVLGTAWIQGTFIATADVFWAVADLHSDGLVNFKDFAVFAAAWPTTLGDPDYNPDCDIFDPAGGIINAMDLAVFADYWLTGLDFGPLFLYNRASILKEEP